MERYRYTISALGGFCYNIDMENSLKLAASIIICEGAGIIGSIFTMPAIGTWYFGIVKPSFNPPNWIFGPVWTALYLLMGISLYLVWKSYQEVSDSQNVKKYKDAFWVFGIQLLLNVAWSLIFFGLHSPLWAFVCIAILWLTILAAMVKFYSISHWAAWLLLPYILWVSFAGVLNLFIAKLN